MAATKRPARRGKITEVQQWASELPDSYLTCRDLGHIWAPFTARWDQKQRVYRQTLMCSRCETERIRLIDERGRPSGGHYSYSDGYQAPKGTGFLSADGRADLRLASILRYANDETENRAAG